MESTPPVLHMKNIVVENTFNIRLPIIFIYTLRIMKLIGDSSSSPFPIPSLLDFTERQRGAAEE